MKELLEEYFGKEIKDYEFYQEVDSENINNYGYVSIETKAKEPCYYVNFKKDTQDRASLSDLLVFIYNKKKND